MQQQSYSDMRRGMINMSAAKYQDAAQSFAKAVIKNPGEAYPHVFLGMALYWQGKVEQAMIEYQEALTLDDKNAEANQLLGIAHAWKGQINEALTYFQTAITLAPNRPDTQMNLGSTYAALGKMDEALYHFRRAAELDGRHPLYQYQLATLLEALGRDTQAEAAFKKALRLYPNYQEAMLALAVLYEKEGKNHSAEVYYNRAIKQKPGDSVARLRLANLLAKQNRHRDAMEVLPRAFSISPLNNEGLGLSMVYTSGGASGGGPSGGTGLSGGAGNQLARLKQKLQKIPATKQINLDAEVEFTPKLTQQIEEANPDEGGALTSPLTEASAPQTQGPSTFSRTFLLPPSDEQTRQDHLDEIFNSIDQLMADAGKINDIKLSLRGGVPAEGLSGGARGAAGASASANANPNISHNNARAGYNPYMVGNDMGLWVAGKGWLKYVEEIAPEGATHGSIISGLANMILGRSSSAQEDFTAAAHTADELTRQLSYLGMGTTQVMSGDDDGAAKSYTEVLKINPDKKDEAKTVAINNLAILSTDEGRD